MSLSETTVRSTETSSGLFAETVGGIATIVLTILGLSNVQPEFLLAIATIVFGAALLIEGTSIAARYANVLSMSPALSASQVKASGLSAIFAAGVTGIILGVLALLGIHQYVLSACAIIVYGSALLLSVSASFDLNLLQASAGRGGEVISGMTGTEALAGIAAIVLGILSLAGEAQIVLALVALLVLGAALLMTGNGINAAIVTMFRGNAAGARAINRP